MTSNRTFVIAGASLAGAKAAETLRTEGFDGRIVLIGDEAVRPYERPPLSKDYLRGEMGFDSAAVHDEGFYEANAIELRTSTLVTAFDTQRSEVTLGSGERIRYDQLLLATGTSPRRLSTPGAELSGVHYLRQLVDADALRRVLTASRRVVVIGAGWIGSEVAASARQLGAEVAVIDPGSVPLGRVLGPEVGAVYRDLHAEHGVEMHFGVTVESIRGTTSVKEVRLTNGTVLPAEVVVVGIGVIPRIELAQGADLVTDNGIAVDEHLATSAPGIYAAGDVANAFHPLYGTRVRLEHWSAALNQGPTAAMNMLGEPTVYDRVPYFFSDQYDLGMEYRGWAPIWDEVVFRGDPATRQFIAFWLLRRRVVAAMNANTWDSGDALEALIRTRLPVDRARLIDPAVDLASLAASSAS
jgi:3-phenylpropionate/trans-cinnamate dioxygenase ferredoxin reductase subunit